MLTGSAIKSEDLCHYNVARLAFRPQLDATISRLVDPEFGHPEFARDLLVALMLHTAELRSGGTSVAR